MLIPAMTLSFPPPAIATPQALGPTLQAQGYAVVAPAQVAALAGLDLDTLLAWRPLWADLPPDNYLRDGGRYRRRRHACFVVNLSLIHI